MRRSAFKHLHRPAPVERLERRVLLAAQPYTWQNAAIGGGGFVDGVFFSPTQENVIYVRTDIGGLYKTTNGGTTWSQLLDFVGPATSPFGFSTNDQDIGVLSFAIDPQNPNNIYADVGEYSGTNGAVFYSTDGGNTWGETNLSFYVGGNSNGRGEGERIAVDPHDSSIILLGSNANGLWESTNSGHSFSQLSSLSTSASINFVYFNPYVGSAGSPTQNIYVGVNSIAGLSPQTTAAEPTNLYQTTNGGSTWTEVAGSSTSPGKNVASTSVSGLSRSGTTATAKTVSATTIEPGDLVTIAGASPSAYDGTFTVASITNSTTFTYTIASGSDTATGTITASVNYSEMPNHVALSSDGNLYLTYSDAQAPDGTQTTGGVYRYNTNSGVWAVISPQVPGVGGNPQYGYMGLALDPESSTTIVVTTINDYSGTDAIYRTTNANAGTPTWVALYSTSSAQNYGYGGYDITRNTSTAPWVAAFGDGIGNWPCSVAIDPFNSGHILYGDGEGLWATNIGNSSTPLTGANSWYFPDTGIEFTAVGTVVAPASGVPLFSAMGDIDGFAHTTLTTSPAAGAIPNAIGPIDFDQANSSYVVDLASISTGGEYTTNDGVTWTSFSSEAGSGGGSIAVAAAPSTQTPTVVWEPSGALPYYSNNNGSTWTLSNMPTGTLTGGRVISDRVTNGTFYYTTENSNDNQFSIYKSTNGGVTFTLVSQLGTGNATLYANPFVAGDLWLADYSGVAHSTNGGSSFTSANGNSSSGVVLEYGYTLAMGAPAPGRTNATIYVWGETTSGTTALFRSDDSGANYIQINDSAHQWGGLVQTLAADPNIFGRLYIGINGRGIIIGNPVGTLPTGWSDSDINTPGDPGWATSSTNLSNGTVVNHWTVDGGGAGITGTSDQFNFASETVAGSASIITQLTSLTNAGTGTPQAGVMFRAGNTAVGDPFAAIVQTTASQLVFEYRTTSGGSITSTALSGFAIGAEYIELVRSGNSYSAFYGTDGIHWTQFGSTVTISAIPTNASAGVAVTSNYNPQLSAAVFSSVQITALPTATVTVTSGNMVYMGSAYVPTTTVTGSSGTDSNATVTYTYYAGSTATGTPLTGAPSAVGTYTVIASFAGDTTYAAANSAATTFAITAKTLTATIIASNKPYDGTTAASVTYSLTGVIGSDAVTASGTASFVSAGAGNGITVNATNITLSGTQAGDYMLASTTATTTANIIKAATTVAVTSSNPSPSFGQLVTFKATITPSSGSGETGTVQFQIDGSNAGSAMNVSGNTATYATSALNAGNNSIVAIYSGDSNYTGSTSSPLPQSVTTAPLNLSGQAFYLKLDSDAQHLDIWTNTTAAGGFSQQVLLSNIGSISISGTTGTDSVVVDFSAGDPLPTGGLTDTGGGSGTADTLCVIGSTGNDSVATSNGQIAINGNAIDTTNVGLTTFTPGIGTDSLSVNSVSLELVPPAAATGLTAMTFSSINVGAGDRLFMAAPLTSATRSVLVTSNLVLAQSAGETTATLDLSANDLILHGGGLSAITSQVQSGYNTDGNWLGTGINSSAAANDTSHLTALGVIQNSIVGTPSGSALFSTFDGQLVTNTDVLVKYTYFGDANLDGVVDGSDYSRIDNGYLHQLTGWYNGDFNYDNLVDGSDYTLIDNAFNSQGARLSAQIAPAQPAVLFAKQKTVHDSYAGILLPSSGENWFDSFSTAPIISNLPSMDPPMDIIHSLPELIPTQVQNLRYPVSRQPNSSRHSTDAMWDRLAESML